MKKASEKVRWSTERCPNFVLLLSPYWRPHNIQLIIPDAAYSSEQVCTFLSSTKYLLPLDGAAQSQYSQDEHKALLFYGTHYNIFHIFASTFYIFIKVEMLDHLQKKI